MPRPKRPPQSFNPRLLLALEQGCKQEVRLPCSSPKAAIRLRYEINTLRSSLRDQKRTDWEKFYQAGLYIDAKDPSVLVIKPKEDEFKSTLDAAGVPALPPAPTVPDQAAPASELEKQTAIDQFLDDLKNLRN